MTQPFADASLCNAASHNPQYTVGRAVSCRACGDLGHTTPVFCVIHGGTNWGIVALLGIEDRMLAMLHTFDKALVLYMW
jgi:hypothetical protein